MKAKRLLFLILPILSILLEASPHGAVLVFGRPASDGTIGFFRQTYSYFSLMPFGYANFAPLLTAVVTCILLGVLAIYCFTGKPALLSAARILACIGAVLSLCPLLLGLRYFSVVGALITLLLLAELLAIHRGITKSKTDQ